MSVVWEGDVGVQQYATEIVEHSEGLLVKQQSVSFDESDDQVILGPEALAAIKQWLEDNE
jgi:hypothetical protein